MGWGASFGMEWNPKQWDWDNLALFSGRETEISKPAHQPEWSAQGRAGIGNGSVSVYRSIADRASSGSELGNGSSKSSISASIDSSPPKAGANKISEFNFDAFEGFSRNPSKNKELARVEDTGTSPVVIATAGPREPLIGLKLGKRTYFEDVCAGNNSKNSSPLASVAPSAALAKKSRATHQSMPSFHCQVEGCNQDLTTAAKDYHRKHRVCESHAKCPEVVVAGRECRFCQQCSRFHDLSEFDQKKRSCRRRLNDHNARRRKPQPETISFNSSRLSSPFYDYGPQLNFMLHRAPFGHTRPATSSGSCGFKLSQMKESWIKSTKGGGTDGQLHFPSTDFSNAVSLRHDLERLLPFKDTTAEVLNQGLEASVGASNLDGAPDLRRALSLLSTESWGPADPRPTPAQFVNANHVSAARPAIHTVNSTAEYWQDENPLAQQARALPFDLHSNGSQFQEFQLLKAPYETTFFDSSQIHGYPKSDGFSLEFDD